MHKIRQYMPDSIQVVSQGEYVATALKDYLFRHREMNGKCTQKGTCTFYTTEAEDKFNESAFAFLNESIHVRKVSLE
jgi:glutamate racemase